MAHNEGRESPLLKKTTGSYGHTAEVQDAATWIVYPVREHLPTRVRFLVDFLSERLKQAELLIEHVNRNPT